MGGVPPFSPSPPLFIMEALIEDGVWKIRTIESALRFPKDWYRSLDFKYLIVIDMENGRLFKIGKEASFDKSTIDGDYRVLPIENMEEINDL